MCKSKSFESVKLYIFMILINPMAYVIVKSGYIVLRVFSSVIGSDHENVGSAWATAVGQGSRMWPSR